MKKQHQHGGPRKGAGRPSSQETMRRRPIGMLVWDCSGDAPTSAWMRRNRIIGEVSYNIARDWGSIGRGMKGAVVCRTVSAMAQKAE